MNTQDHSPTSPTMPIPMHKQTLLPNVGPQFEPTAAENMKALIQDCGVSPHKIAELLQELPPPRFSAALVDFYFSSV
jgi:hypothetical protein